jgi:hypothetical protein
MQDRPTAAEALDAISELLRDELLPDIGAEHRFQLRVAVNLLGVVERELREGPALERAERERLIALLDADGEWRDQGDGPVGADPEPLDLDRERLDPSGAPDDANREPLDPKRELLDPKRGPLDPKRGPLDPKRGPLDPKRELLELNRELARRVREDEIDWRSPALLDHLRATAEDRVRIANPRYLTPPTKR